MSGMISPFNERGLLPGSRSSLKNRTQHMIFSLRRSSLINIKDGLLESTSATAIRATGTDHLAKHDIRGEDFYSSMFMNGITRK